MPTVPSHVLNDGTSIPAIGFGTYRHTGAAGTAAVAQALRDGYRLVDTAAAYGNEAEVGRGVAESGVPREEVVVTSKVRGRDQGYDATLRAFDATLAALSLDRLDLYLIHWPLPHLDRYVATWRALVRLREEGRVRSIGVSNFTAEHLDRVADASGVMPAVNQVEMHPYFPQPRLRAANAARGVLTQSWSPLGRKTDLLADPVVVEVAAAHAVTPAQAVLRWHLELGAVPIPKASSPDRWRTNLDVLSFTLTEEETDRLAALERGRIGGDPETYEEL